MTTQQAQEPKVPAGWVDSPWDGSAAQWGTAEAYCSACLIDVNSGGAKIKDLCALPYKEPGSGKINVRGVLAAAGGRGITRLAKPDGVDAGKWAAAKRGAARKLVSMYRRMRREPPEAVSRMAGG